MQDNPNRKTAVTTPTASAADLATLITRLAFRTRAPLPKPNVLFEGLSHGSTLYPNNRVKCDEVRLEMEHLNHALAAADEIERRDLTIEIFRAWCRQGENGQNRLIFGDVATLYSGRAAILTLTGDGRQLRVWYGFPGRMKYDHVDSCGSGLLFGVYGDPPSLEEYLRAFREVLPLMEARNDAGVRIYIGYE